MHVVNQYAGTLLSCGSDAHCLDLTLASCEGSREGHTGNLFLGQLEDGTHHFGSHTAGQRRQTEMSPSGVTWNCVTLKGLVGQQDECHGVHGI